MEGGGRSTQEQRSRGARYPRTSDVLIVAGSGAAVRDNAAMPRIELFAFRYRDPRTRKWIRARYVATREEIAARYAEWEIIGPAEVRNVDPAARAFSPHRPFKQMMDAELRRYSEQPPELQPAIDAAEAFLLAVFLRRYVTYCARRGRFGAVDPPYPAASG